MDTAEAYRHRRFDSPGSVYYNVGPGAILDEDTPTSLEQAAQDAASLLRADCTVHWMPGEGSNYILRLLKDGYQSYLAFLNPSFPGLLLVHEGRVISVREWVSSSAPTGGYRGLRPLLVALGGKTGSRLYAIPHYLQVEEAKERAAQYRNQYVEPGDADLGRQVRLLVQARGKES